MIKNTESRGSLHVTGDGCARSMRLDWSLFLFRPLTGRNIWLKRWTLFTRKHKGTRDQGHYVEVVTNGTASKRFDEIINLSINLLERLAHVFGMSKIFGLGKVMKNKWKLILLLSFIILAVMILYRQDSIGSDSTEEQVITVIFRYDDPSARTNTDLEVKLIDVFRQNNVCCLWSVVPFVCAQNVHDPTQQEELPLPVEKAEIFAKAAHEGTLEIALHGYSHQTTISPRRGRPYTEFSGLKQSEQMRRIRQGKTFLEAELGLDVRVFVPPWNTYDANTIKVLQATGFKTISGSMSGPGDLASSLAFLPTTCSIADVKEVVASARMMSDPAPAIVVLFHQYDFVEVDKIRGVATLNSFLETLQWVSQQGDVNIVPMTKMLNVGNHRYIANQQLRSINGVLPPALRGMVGQIYLSEEGIRNLTAKVILSLITFYTGLVLVVGVVSFLAACVVRIRMSVLVYRLSVFMDIVLFSCSVVYLFHGNNCGAEGVMGIFGTGTYCTVTWSVLVWHRYQLCKTRCPHDGVNRGEKT